MLTGMTAADPAARPSAREVATILDELPTTSPLAWTVVADESPTRVRTKPMTVAPMMPLPGLRRFERVDAAAQPG
jgi:hypothetical protein